MTSPLVVYFDGLCPLCSREINHYRKKAPTGSIEFVDIAEEGFNAADHGLDPVRVNRHFHVKEGDRLHVGVDGFRALWQVIPGFRWLRKITGLPVVYPGSKLLYAVFARLRPYLPKRRRCESDRCQV